MSSNLQRSKTYASSLTRQMSGQHNYCRKREKRARVEDRLLNVHNTLDKLRAVTVLDFSLPR